MFLLFAFFCEYLKVPCISQCPMPPTTALMNGDTQECAVDKQRCRQKESQGCAAAQMQYLFLSLSLSSTNTLMHAQVLTDPS